MALWYKWMVFNEENNTTEMKKMAEIILQDKQNYNYIKAKKWLAIITWALPEWDIHQEKVLSTKTVGFLEHQISILQGQVYFVLVVSRIQLLRLANSR